MFRANGMLAIGAITRKTPLVCARAAARGVRFGTLLHAFGTLGDEQDRASGRPSPVGREIDVPNKERRKAVTRLLIKTALLFGGLAAITPAQAGIVSNDGVAAIVVVSNAVAVSGATLDDAVSTVIEVRTPR